MGCFDDAITGMMEPYGGNMPLFRGDQTDATVTIVQESYDNGMNITRIQTPPRTETSKLMEAINAILGIFGDTCPSLDKDGQKSDKSSDKDGEKDDKSKQGDNLQPFGKSEESEDSSDNESEEHGGSGQDMSSKRIPSKSKF